MAYSGSGDRGDEMKNDIPDPTADASGFDWASARKTWTKAGRRDESPKVYTVRRTLRGR